MKGNGRFSEGNYEFTEKEINLKILSTLGLVNRLRQAFTVNNQRSRVLNGAGQIRGQTRVVALMVAADRIDVQDGQPFAHLRRRYERFVDRLTIQLPAYVNRQIAYNHIAIDVGRLAKISWLVGESERRDFRGY